MARSAKHESPHNVETLNNMEKEAVMFLNLFPLFHSWRHIQHCKPGTTLLVLYKNKAKYNLADKTLLCLYSKSFHSGFSNWF